jgi:hypothetical protein
MHGPICTVGVGGRSAVFPPEPSISECPIIRIPPPARQPIPLRRGKTRTRGRVPGGQAPLSTPRPEGKRAVTRVPSGPRNVIARSVAKRSRGILAAESYVDVGVKRVPATEFRHAASFLYAVAGDIGARGILRRTVRERYGPASATTTLVTMNSSAQNPSVSMSGHVPAVGTLKSNDRIRSVPRDALDPRARRAARSRKAPARARTAGAALPRGFAS